MERKNKGEGREEEGEGEEEGEKKGGMGKRSMTGTLNCVVLHTQTSLLYM